MVNSDMVKGALSGLTGILDVLASDFGQVAIKMGLFVAGGVGVAKIISKIVSAGKALMNLHIASTITAWTSSSAAWIRAGGEMAGVNSKLFASLDKIKAILNPMSIATSALTVAVVGLGVAAGTLAKATYDNYKKTHQYTESVEKLQKANKKRLEQTVTEQREAHNYAKSLMNINKIEGKTLRQKEELKKYVEKLNELYPDLNLAYDENSDAITDNTGKVIDNLEALEKLIDKSYEAAKAQAYQANANAALEKRINLEGKLADATLEVEEAEEELTKAGQTYGIESAEYATAMEVYTVKLEKYRNKLQAVAKAQLEYNKYANLETMEGDEYASSKAAYEKDIGESVGSDVINKIKSGLYTAPVTKKEWKKLLAFDDAVKEAEDLGIEIPDSVYAGIQEGTYSAPSSGRALRRLVNFDEAVSEAKVKGVEISQDLVDSFQDASPAMQRAWNDVIGAINSSDIDSEVFSNIFNNAELSAEEKMSQIVEIINQRRTELGQDPIEIPITIGKTTEGKSGKGSDSWRGSLGLNDAEIKIPVSIEDNASSQLDTIASKSNLGEAKKTISQSGYKGVKNKLDTLKDYKSDLGTSTKTIKTEYIEVHKAGGTRSFTGYAKGTSKALNPNAQVNEQGFEIIQSPDGSMRVADAGKRTETFIEKGSAVYTHGQSMRMLAQARLTEADLLQGKTGDIGVYGIKKLEGFKKGKSKKKLRNQFDKDLEYLEYQRDLNNWTDKDYQTQYTALVNQQKYAGKLSADQMREYNTTIAEIERSYAQDAIDDNMELFENSKLTYNQMEKIIKDYYNSGKINAEEYNDYIEDLNKQQIENTKEQYENQWDYLSAYIQRQIDLEEENNEVLEAQSELLSATSQKVKVYKEGVGFVYEADESAVKEAQENLKDTSSIWEQIQDMMDNAESQIELQQLATMSGSGLVSAVANAGTDLSTWANIIGLVGGNMGAYDLASDLGITDKNAITTTNTINGQTFNIDNVSLPNVTNANDFVSQLQSLAIQQSATR